MAMSQENLWATVTTGAGSDVFRLRELWGEEQVSGLFRFELELESKDSEVDFEKIVGKPGAVTLTLPNKKKRYFHGLVTRLRQGTTDPDVTRYRAEIRPWFWMLTQSSGCRIFQEKSVPEILELVFKDLGFSDFKKSLNGTYTKRDYCVQYRETAFDFCSRLMEEEGIFYFFEHSASAHKLVLADEASAHVDCPALSEVRYRGTSTEAHAIDIVTACSIEQVVTTNSYALDDFSFETPTTDLESEVGSGDLARYDYPGGFLKKADGEKLAKLRLAVHTGEKDRVGGESFCPAFCSGYKFTLKDHPRADANKAYALRSVQHQLSQESYRNTFSAYPADVAFRPPLTTPKPVIPGTQTAIVVGKSGEEIWTDEFGRIKVLFHWDRVSKGDEKSSCWIRVTQGWAGKNWGAFFLPRIGQEVVVTFLEGDPDRPLVTGAVYNAEQTVPYALPANQTRSTVKSDSSKGGDGFNEIRFEDKKESEELYVHAQKDMNTEVLNDSTTTITNNRVVTVSEGDETHTVAKGSRTVTVSEGDETHTVEKGKRTLSVKADESHTNEANFTQEVKGDFTLKVTGSVTIQAGGDITIESDASVTVKSGTALTNQAGTAMTNKSGTAMTNKAGTAMTNQAGTTLTNKGSASQTVDGGGMLTLKGGLVKVN